MCEGGRLQAVGKGAERVVVCAAEELPPGTRRIMRVGARSIGVFNVGVLPAK